jgi:UDP-N-acetylglucosamine acyltransferase
MENNIYDYEKNNVHPTAWIDPSVKLGKGNTIGAFTVIHSGVEIGDNNKIGSHTVIGGNGEIRNASNFKGKVKIGSRNLINHHVTIDKPINGYTIIGNDNFIMTKSHLGHDVIISNNVTISSGAMIGGHTQVHDYANIGLNAEIHQRKIIGQGAMVGMGSSIIKNVYPFTKVVSVNSVIGYNIMKINQLDLSMREVMMLGREFEKDFE